MQGYMSQSIVCARFTSKEYYSPNLKYTKACKMCTETYTNTDMQRICVYLDVAI